MIVAIDSRLLLSSFFFFAAAAAAAAAPAAAQPSPFLRQSAYLKAANAAELDRFGASVSLSGPRLAVGAFDEGSCVAGNPQDTGCEGAGAVFVFEFDAAAGNWTQTAYVKAGVIGGEDNFGQSVSLEGDRLAVGAPGEDSCATGVGGDATDNACLSSGAAYVFELTAGVWTQRAYIKPNNTGASDNFGERLSLSGDRLAVAAQREDSCSTGVNGRDSDDGCAGSGAVYVFDLDLGWFQTAYLKASNAQAEDAFGVSVSLDGSRLAVGASLEDSCSAASPADDSCASAGALYVFDINTTTDEWYQSAYLKAESTGLGDLFGESVHLVGSRLLVGAPGESSCATGVNGSQANNACSGAGAAYLFTRVAGPNMTSTWVLTAYFKADNTEAGDRYGLTLRLSGDRILVSSVDDSCSPGINSPGSDNGCTAAGAAYLYTRDPGSGDWSQLAYLKGGDPQQFDQFGQALALEGDRVVVGSPDEDSCTQQSQTDNNCLSAGAVSVFEGSVLTGAMTTASPSSSSTTPAPPPPPSSAGENGDDAGDEGEGNGSGESALVPILAAAIGGACALLLLLAGAAFFVARRRRRGRDSSGAGSVEMPSTNNSSGSDQSSAYVAMSSKAPSGGDEDDRNNTYATFVTSAHAPDLTEQVEIAKEIGKGNFGRVFRGEYKGSGVAIKQILADAEEDAQKDFAQELGIMLKLNSKRIIKLFGICQLPDAEGGGMGLVMELAAKGSLDEHLQREGDTLSETALLEIAQHIAEGLVALHRASVVHRDLAARNVLVTMDGMCKLADFGLSRSLGEEETYTATSALPVRWTAPETLSGAKVTQASDLYSLAMTLLEVFDGGALPFADMDNNMDIIGLVTAGKRPPQPERCPDDVFAIMETLWAQEPKDRGKAKAAATQLRDLHAAAGEEQPEETYVSVFASRRGLYDEWGS